jgi:hypothetical protein
VTGCCLNEPQGIAFPALIAPAYAVAGVSGVELVLAALLALAFVAAASLARRLAPEPWATGATLVAGLSPPALGASIQIGPEGACALLLAGGALLALHVRDAPRRGSAVGCALLIAALPWLSPYLAIPAAVVAFALWRWLRRRQRALTGFICVEIGLIGLIAYSTANNHFFGGLVPQDAALPGSGGLTGAGSLGEYLERSPRLLGLLIDRDAGLLTWAPFLAMALAGLWALWTSRRDLIASAIPGRVDAEVAATLCASTALAVLLTAVFLLPTFRGAWFPGRDLVPALGFLAALAAWGLHRNRRTGVVLAAITLAGSAWLLVAGRVDGGAGLRPPQGDLPWGGVQDLLPLFGQDSASEIVVIAFVACCLVAVTVRETLLLRDRRAASPPA